MAHRSSGTLRFAISDVDEFREEFYAIIGKDRREERRVFSIASYNVLAGAYIQRAFYPRTPALVLSPAWRIPAVLHQVSALNSDLICLQEVEPDLFAGLRSRLLGSGYTGWLVTKRGGQPDGCAIFYRRPFERLLDAQVLEFTDGSGAEADSGNIAVAAIVEVLGKQLGIVNTHLTWDPPGLPLEARRGYRQARQLLSDYRSSAVSGDGWILAGDFNATPDDRIVSAIERAGFRYAHQEDSEAHTCNFNSQAKMIDYLFHSSTLQAKPEPISPVDDDTVLPSAEYPSDHVPVVARFDWIS